MSFSKAVCSLVAILLSFSNSTHAAEFELKDGDKVVWLGSTLIEREQRYGYWEAALTARWPDRKITFRNLGWSGDNVFGEARLAFDINNPSLGLKRMVDLTLAEKPTVIFICYGMNESFEGKEGLERFEKGYEKLLDALKPAKARIVLMTPTPLEHLNSLPANVKDNRIGNLTLYCEAIRKLAKARELRVADLFYRFGVEELLGVLRPPHTDNGIHLNEFGYSWSASLLKTELGFKDSRGDSLGEPLRQAIIEKNKLYFYRWRPQNETYLFGFRKKEQGQNAKEIAEFDPLISKAEAEIDRLKKVKK
ncbi:MAG: SGNH/GDSL hydrolase family protein [Planctomycetes bacterium]|nr:SGNH/GDSL hydrolase family protein [Planctomycetota bacterium]